jgi:hypothetical protein
MSIDLLNPPYPFDPTGRLLSNKISGEQQILTAANYRDYNFIVPAFAPFFQHDLVVSFRDINNNVRLLIDGIDFYCTHNFIAASRACADPIFGSISMLDLQLNGVVTIQYQTLGGIWTQDETKIAELAADRLNNPRVTAWDMVAEMPTAFPPIDHEWDLVDMVGMTDVRDKIEDIGLAIAARPNDFYTRAEVDAIRAALEARITALEQQ